MHLAQTAAIQHDRTPWQAPKLLRNCLVTDDGKIWCPPGNPELHKTLDENQTDVDLQTGSVLSKSNILALGSSRARYDTAVTSPTDPQTEYESFWYSQQYEPDATLSTASNLVNLTLIHVDPQTTATPNTAWEIEYSDEGDSPSNLYTGLPGRLMGVAEYIFSYSGSHIDQGGHYTKLTALASLTDARLNDSGGMGYVNGPYAAFYAGRRFVALSHDPLYLDRIVYSQVAGSGAGDLVTYDGYIDINQGAQHGEYSASRITALLNYGTNLLVCKHDGVFLLSAGGDELPFSISPMQTRTGPVAQNTAVPYGTGYIWLGGFPESLGLYSFNGGATAKISDEIDAWLDGWAKMHLADVTYSNFIREGATDYLFARSYVELWNEHLILRGYDLGEENWGQTNHDSGATALGLDTCALAVCNLTNGAWSAFDGWDEATPAMAKWSPARAEAELFLAQGNAVYKIDEQYPMLRWNNANAKINFGWFSDPSPLDMYRFMALRMLVYRKEVNGDITVTITPTGQDGFVYDTQARTLTVQGWTELIFPLNFRDATMRVDVDVAFANSADQFIIDTVELLYIQKPAKLAYDRRYPAATGVHATVDFDIEVVFDPDVYLDWSVDYWDVHRWGPGPLGET